MNMKCWNDIRKFDNQTKYVKKLIFTLSIPRNIIIVNVMFFYLCMIMIPVPNVNLLSRIYSNQICNLVLIQK
jgi:hypothetical protein